MAWRARRDKGATAAWFRYVRFCVTGNSARHAGLAAAPESSVLPEAEVEGAAIERQILALTRQLAAGLRERGAEIHGPRGEPGAPEAACSGIVSFRLPGQDSPALLARLRRANICCAERQGYIRCAPHFYNSPEEIGRLLAALG